MKQLKTRTVGKAKTVAPAVEPGEGKSRGEALLSDKVQLPKGFIGVPYNYRNVNRLKS